MSKTIQYWFWDARQAQKDGKKMTAVDIAILLRSDLTHVEKRFDANRGYVSYSSTSADDADGGRFKYIDYSHPKRWRVLAFEVTDSEEQMIWEKCCDKADMPYDWQENTNLYFDGKKYQGPNHIRYDFIGLLSFALEKSPTWWRNIQRWAMWFWTVIIKPDPNKEWCSESTSDVWNRAAMMYGKFERVEIDPQEMWDTMKKFKGVRVVSSVE